uniref:Uncharacterized protein n=1 Tax=Cannabis sativa TaxID=3483 RepID=A0A803NLF5_CANSA
MSLGLMMTKVTQPESEQMPLSPVMTKVTQPKSERKVILPKSNPQSHSANSGYKCHSVTKVTRPESEQMPLGPAGTKVTRPKNEPKSLVQRVTLRVTRPTSVTKVTLLNSDPKSHSASFSFKHQRNKRSKAKKIYLP